MDLWLLGVLRVLYKGYEQAVILVGIMDLNVNWDWEFKSVILGIWAGSNFSGNHGFECELWLLGVLRVLYRGYKQAVILVGIIDLNVHCDYWEFQKCFIGVCAGSNFSGNHGFVTIGSSKSVLRVLWPGCNFSGNQGFECKLWLLGVLRVLYRDCEQAVILVGIMYLNVHCDCWEF